jgi:hypothetical protein
MYINEQVYTNIHHGDWGSGDTTHDEKIKLLVGAIERQLKSWKASLPVELADNCQYYPRPDNKCLETNKLKQTTSASGTASSTPTPTKSVSMGVCKGSPYP